MIYSLTLTVVPARFAICRLAPDAPLPAWATAGEFVSFTRTPEELSIVCRQATVPEGVVAERDWRCIKAEGPLDFSLTGVLASLTSPLAEAGVSVFALSTYLTDYLLVREDDLERAVDALNSGGHYIQREEI